MFWDLPLCTGSFKGGWETTAPGPALLVARKGLARRKKTMNWKEYFLILSKKETRTEGINASKLAILNFNDNTGKHMNTSCVFYLNWFSLKTKTFQAQVCKKQTYLIGYSACKNLPLSCTAH